MTPMAMQFVLVNASRIKIEGFFSWPIEDDVAFAKMSVDTQSSHTGLIWNTVLSRGTRGVPELYILPVFGGALAQRFHFRLFSSCE